MASSPRITHVSWGRLEVEGHGAFKDAKIFPGGARTWDWSDTDTHHTPGIQPRDVEEVLEEGATVVVLSRGMARRLRVAQEILDLLKNRGVPCHVLATREAVRLYNELRELEPVGGLFHSTC